jgi:hypothetical protein
MSQSSSPSSSAEPLSGPETAPTYRPEERFWPYTELSEQPDAEELASLDPDLRDALYGPADQPFSITLVFPRFEGPTFERALELARAGVECREVGDGPDYRVRARFLPSESVGLRDCFELVGHVKGCEVLIDGRPLPCARELWLPLVWFLIPR